VCALVATISIGTGSAMAQAEFETIIRVDINSPTTTGDGSSWSQAFDTLQKALDVTDAILISRKTPVIWVADGTY